MSVLTGGDGQARGVVGTGWAEITNTPAAHRANKTWWGIQGQSGGERFAEGGAGTRFPADAVRSSGKALYRGGASCCPCEALATLMWRMGQGYGGKDFS